MKVHLIVLALVLFVAKSAVLSHAHSGVDNRRALVNITIDTDDVTEEPLTASDLVIRTKLMAYAQKLAAKEQKKKLKEEKLANKAAMLSLGLPPALWPPAPTPSSNDTTPGFWLYSKSVFLSKLFTALANAAATLPGVSTTTAAPGVVASTESADLASTENPALVNDISKRSPRDYSHYKKTYKHKSSKHAHHE